MREEMITPFLPLGSILRLVGTEDDQLLYFVVARAIAKNEEEKVIARYRVAPIRLEMYRAKKSFLSMPIKSQKCCSKASKTKTMKNF
ncbi:hypothetical protein EMQU_2788 [Enterococcus mundtii QU 25]|uniref:hypothetical protein n=1 Tax=Enterococcus mundtii TaxID=53346 RepID=UPI0003C56250|nr:hypothetical protein [Enterococcus mundtii]BAO08345.1 hypothetical protein EMQU_2788 [Enterococcus mundtii QU 25]